MFKSPLFQFLIGIRKRLALITSISTTSFDLPSMTYRRFYTVEGKAHIECRIVEQE
jgi:hypothetical protein